MANINKLDEVILVVIDKYSIMTVIQLSSHLQLDKPILYKSIKNLCKYNLISETSDRPKKYYINQKKYEKWLKNN